MSWSGRSDRDGCCDGPYGAVNDDECVARLLHNKITNPDRAAFSRKELAAEGLPLPSNACGDADGVSVDRMIGLSDVDVVARSAAYAGLKDGRIAEGARIASVLDLRSITHEDVPDGQAVVIYDDPRADNDRHAVIRLSDQVPRADFKLMQARVISVFTRHAR